MKRLLITLLAILFSCICIAQIQATSEEIADQLDLKAIAALYGEATNVADFENKINSEDYAISNLDLNGDGQVDYLRCVETQIGTSHYIVIQAVLAKDIYQDIATIYTNKTDNIITTQVVGNEYIYGKNYIIEPVYIYRPVIYSWYYGGLWTPYCSPYYWNYYPPYWHYRYCIHHDHYWRHIHEFHGHHHVSYAHPHKPHGDMHNGNHHNGYADQHHGQSFEDRHPHQGNYRDVNNSRHPQQPTRSTATVRQPQQSGSVRSQNQTIQQTHRSSTVQQPINRTVQPNRSTQPSRSTQTVRPAQPSNRSSVQPSRSTQPTRTSSARSAPTSTSRSSAPVSRPSGGSPSRSGGPSRGASGSTGSRR